MASDHSYVLVTGANTGLGFGICRRLIDEFLSTRPANEELTLIFTTRSNAKGSATLKSLQSHLTRHGQKASRIYFRPENVELTSLLSVRALARALAGPSGIPKLDAAVLNAGVGGITGINFPLATWQILLENASATTWPRFKLSSIGSVTEPQIPSGDVSETPLGQIFCANVFGHYMLSHWLMPLLRKCKAISPGRVIWISSIEASAEHLNPDDLQGLTSPTVYEHSKRVTDVLALTATEQPATKASVQQFTSIPDSEAGINTVPAVLLAHPGIVATSFVPLPPVLMALWTGVAYVMRWIGSPWHTNSAYNGAASATWLALAPLVEIKQKQGQRMVKWGSAVDRAGNVRVEVTDVPGWGIDGSGDSIKEKWWGKGWGRMIGMVDATAEDVERFVEQGARVWREMEALREEWEGRILRHEKDMHRQG